VTYTDLVDKDGLLFTQCSDIIYLRCPICAKIKKVLRQCKIFKKFPSLWIHIKREHSDLPPAQLEEITQVVNGIFKAFKLQMLPKWEYSEAKIEPTTSSSSILFDGRPPRIDVIEKIQKIGRLFKGQSKDYPSFKQKQVLGLIKVILGNVDERTKKKYFDCVTSNSIADRNYGVYDVTQFCNIVGV